MAGFRDDLRWQIDETRFVDTHEHLMEERTRLKGAGANVRLPCDDAALLFDLYVRDDLWSAGMAPDEQARFFAPDVEPRDKWPLLARSWLRCRHTGCGRAITETLRILWGIEELDGQAFVQASDRMRDGARPGFYRRVLNRAAGVEACQVNSIEATFCESEYPDLLQQDLSIVGFSTRVGPEVVQDFGARSGLPTTTLADWHRVIDWAFETWGSRAVAVKSQSAYERRLDYQPVSAEEAAPLYARLTRREALAPTERKALEDHLMRYCVVRAGEMALPVKLPCGYYGGVDRMPLARVRQNAGDVCGLLRDFPTARFVLMHTGYPYQDEYVALAKHYRNVYVDLCWAWIAAPRAAVSFVKEFLTAAPSNKLFTFGGDYTNVENIVGHAAVARQGLHQALAELVEEGWLREEDALDLVEPLMRGNQHDAFPTFGQPSVELTAS